MDTDSSNPSPDSDWPISGRLLGIDYGTVRMGLALSDPSQTWVTPLDTYLCRNPRLDGKFFSQLAADERLSGMVVGLPLHCDGQESQKSKEVRAFAKWLEDTTGLPIALFDERFTTAEARRLLAQHELSPKKKKQKLDGVAAHLILSHFLESRRSRISENEGLE